MADPERSAREGASRSAGEHRTLQLGRPRCLVDHRRTRRARIRAERCECAGRELPRRPRIQSRRDRSPAHVWLDRSFGVRRRGGTVRRRIGAAPRGPA